MDFYKWIIMKINIKNMNWATTSENRISKMVLYHDYYSDLKEVSGRIIIEKCLKLRVSKPKYNFD